MQRQCSLEWKTVSGLDSTLNCCVNGRAFKLKQLTERTFLSWTEAGSAYGYLQTVISL